MEGITPHNQTTFTKPIMTKQQIINLAADRLTPGFLEENDISGFMSTVIETFGDNGVDLTEFFGTRDRNEITESVYWMAEEVRILYLENWTAALA